MGDIGGLLAAMIGAGGLIGAAATGAPSAPAGAPSTTSVSSAAVSSPGALPNFGNPSGHVAVPPAGRAVNTSHANHWIGHGTPASCTSAAVVRAVAEGGIIRFRCGPKPVTIVMGATATVRQATHPVILDGRGLITLSGGGKRRILYSNTCLGDCTSPYPQIVVQNITFEDGFNGARENLNAPWGGIDGGGAIYVSGGQFKAVNSRFIDNRCYTYGPDLGGAAIRALNQYKNRPVYITSDTFRGGRCANGGALSSIDVQWQVLNSLFTNNRAIGRGANPARPGTRGGGSGGGIYTDGSDYDVFVAGTVMTNNVANEGGGAIFNVVDDGWGKLTLDYSHLHHNPSLGFQTFPGIFDHIDNNDVAPVMIHSTDN